MAVYDGSGSGVHDSLVLAGRNSESAVWKLDSDQPTFPSPVMDGAGSDLQKRSELRDTHVLLSTFHSFIHLPEIQRPLLPPTPRRQ